MGSRRVRRLVERFGARYTDALSTVSSRQKTERLDKLLVDRQMFQDERSALRWIMAGEVLVNGQPVIKPGHRVNIDSDINIRGFDQIYASRGGYKLAAALDSFALVVEGKVVLDAGAAAGGFTSCLLQRGAKLVYAVDVGYGQMKGSLASHPSVRNMERTNIGDLKAEMFDPPLDLAVVDLSYLSLAKAIPVLIPLFRRPVVLICLIKPLFEGASQLHKNSVAGLRAALSHVYKGVRNSGLFVADLMASPVQGSRGTIEFLGLVNSESTSDDAFGLLQENVLTQAANLFPDLIEI